MGAPPPPRLRPQHARGTCSGHPTATFQKKPSVFQHFRSTENTSRHAPTLLPLADAQLSGVLWRLPAGLTCTAHFCFAHGPPFYTQLTEWPRAHMGPVGFSRGGNGALDRGPLCEGVLGHPRPAQPTVGPSAVVVGHPFVLAPSGFRLRSGVRRIPRWEGCGGRSDPRALRTPSTWAG